MTATLAPERIETTAPATTEPQLAGVIAEFETPHALIQAVRRVRQAGYVRFDAHSPFPIHGIDDAIGIRPTRLAWLVLAAGVSGFWLALLLQWWTNAVDYPFLISGKPLFSIPANIPIAFEVSILLSAFAALFGMLFRNGLPRFSNPLFRSERFLRVTTDRFFVSIEASDPQFDAESTPAFLSSLGALHVEECWSDPAERRIPRPVVLAALVLIVLALVPPVLIARARYATSSEPRIHPVTDMDFQRKFNTQTASSLFADGRAMRPPQAGTIARGELQSDDRLYRGLEPGAGAMVRSAGLASAAPADLDKLPWISTLPIPVTHELIQRGQERYNIYCSVCHGLGGDGDGLVTRRAMELEQGTWVQPISLHADSVRHQPVGRLFHSITNGVRKMPGYGDQIPLEDRWAIVLYVKALQRSRHATLNDVPPELRPTLKNSN